MSQLVFSTQQNSEELGSNANEGMVLLARQGKADKGKLFLFCVLKASSRKHGPNEIWINKVCLPTLTILVVVDLLTSSRICLPFWGFCSKWSQVGNQD